MGNVTHYQYDGKGQISRITGPAQNGKENTVTYQYSEAGQLLAVTDAEGLVTTYRYDNNSNLISQTDSAGNAREWIYNSNNQKTAESVRAAGSTDQYDTLCRKRQESGQVCDFTRRECQRNSGITSAEK
jgi:YD repeat-containing protein